MILTTSQYNRPQYTRKMLDSLSKVYGIEDVELIASLDRDERGFLDDEVYELFESVNFCDVTIIPSDDRLTCNMNTLKALYSGFRRSYFVLHVEDDILLAHDSLDLAYEYADRDLEEKYFSLSLFNRLEKDGVNGEFGTVLERPHFVPWGFVLSRNIFEKALWANCFCPDASHYLSWDLRFNNLRASLGMSELFPKFSRSNNIGKVGTHMWEEHWESSVKLDYWAGNVDFEQVEFDFQISKTGRLVK